MIRFSVLSLFFFSLAVTGAGCSTTALDAVDTGSTGSATVATTGDIEGSTGEDPSGTGYVDDDESSSGAWDPGGDESSSSSGGGSSDGGESSTGDSAADVDPLSCEYLCDPVNISGPPEALEECGCACDYLCVVEANGLTNSMMATFACGLTWEPIEVGASYVIECLPALEGEDPVMCDDVCGKYPSLDACVAEEGPDSSFCYHYFDSLCGCE